jgi:hypothetical protein
MNLRRRKMDICDSDNNGKEEGAESDDPKPID